MNLSGLNFSSLPAISIVYRFFICAVLFALVAAFLLAFSGPEVWQSRWHPHMLAITHCFTLGFITTVMMGAMLQILPVIGGIGIPKVKLVANTFLVLHVVGTACLIAGFISPLATLKVAAMIFLAMGFGVYLIALGWVLAKKLSQGSSIFAIRFAVLALLVTLVLGLLMLARNLGWQIIPFDKFITDLHAIWGIAGWIGLLLIAVSFQIIPMFHVAPEFNASIRRYLPMLILGLLLVLFFGQAQVQILVLLLLLSNSIFIGYLCYLLSLRKRKIPDATVNFWRLSTLAMISVFVLYCLGENLLSVAGMENQTLLLTALVIYLYVVSIMLGMLLKIMPFLSYTHLQQRCLLDFSLMPLLPNMHQFLPKKHGNMLFYLHLLSALALLLTLVFNQFYLLLALTLGLEFFWLLTLLVRCKRLYNATLKQIENR
ncbi:hypothetical protein [Thalassotalea sp. ND16A]|uniref:hypothetical protein n=1 Tax=Thalassotalea sp. ND16A TaxID=1535422 RepID=UPI00051A2A9C|nr:hypothetical protein [Thalassotalea sp. ND16A]KGJ98512.1 hypothetical protein ND16A_0582 [Thalassotalea sp. ND16A]